LQVRHADRHAVQFITLMQVSADERKLSQSDDLTLTRCRYTPECVDPMDGAEAQKSLPGTLQMCSRDAGWHSLLLQKHRHEAAVDVFDVPASSDLLIVLLMKGGGPIEKFSRGKWERAQKMPGCLSFNAPGEEARLRWRGEERHEVLEVRLGAATLDAAIEHMRDTTPKLKLLPHRLHAFDPVVSAILVSLEKGVADHLPDLYAESAAHFLALHLLNHPASAIPSSVRASEDARLRRVDEFMRVRLADPLSLGELAAVAGLGTFQFIRLCKSHWSETPYSRLTRLRMEHGQYLLGHTDADIVTIAFECGYGNPSHFATAFRRMLGKSPSEYRQDRS